MTKVNLIPRQAGGIQQAGSPGVEFISQLAPVPCMENDCAIWNSSGGCCGLRQSGGEFHRKAEVYDMMKVLVEKFTGEKFFGKGGETVPDVDTDGNPV